MNPKLKEGSKTNSTSPFNNQLPFKPIILHAFFCVEEPSPSEIFHAPNNFQQQESPKTVRSPKHKSSPKRFEITRVLNGLSGLEQKNLDKFCRTEILYQSPSSPMSSSSNRVNPEKTRMITTTIDTSLTSLEDRFYRAKEEDNFFELISTLRKLINIKTCLYPSYSPVVVNLVKAMAVYSLNYASELALRRNKSRGSKSKGSNSQFNKSYEIIKEIEGNLVKLKHPRLKGTLLALMYHNLGSIFGARKKMNAALKFSVRALKKWKSLQCLDYLFFFLLKYADNLYAIGDLKKAIKKFETILSFVGQIDNISEIIKPKSISAKVFLKSSQINLQSFKVHFNKLIEIIARYNISLAHYKTKNYKSSLKNIELAYGKLQDFQSLFNNNNNNDDNNDNNNDNEAPSHPWFRKVERTYEFMKENEEKMKERASSFGLKKDDFFNKKYVNFREDSIRHFSSIPKNKKEKLFKRVFKRPPPSSFLNEGRRDSTGESKKRKQLNFLFPALKFDFSIIINRSTGLVTSREVNKKDESFLDVKKNQRPKTAESSTREKLTSWNTDKKKKKDNHEIDLLIIENFRKSKDISAFKDMKREKESPKKTKKRKGFRKSFEVKKKKIIKKKKVVKKKYASPIKRIEIKKKKVKKRKTPKSAKIVRKRSGVKKKKVNKSPPRVEKKVKKVVKSKRKVGISLRERKEKRLKEKKEKERKERERKRRELKKKKERKERERKERERNTQKSKENAAILISKDIKIDEKYGIKERDAVLRIQRFVRRCLARKRLNKLRKGFDDAINAQIKLEKKEMYLNLLDQINIRCKVKSFPIVLTGFVGVGKGNVMKELLKLHPHAFREPVFEINREKEKKEVEAVDFYFMNDFEMNEKQDNGEYVQFYTEHDGTMIGLSSAEVKRVLNNHMSCIIESKVEATADVVGDIEKLCNVRPLVIILKPPNLRKYKDRLERKDSANTLVQLLMENYSDLERKLEKMNHDIVVNDDAKKCAKKIGEIYRKKCDPTFSYRHSLKK